MLDGDRRRDLLRLRGSGSDRVAFRTVDALPAGMIVMTEDGLENGSGRNRPSIRGRFVTDITGTDLALRSMTGKTIIMRPDPGRNRFRRALRLMTGGTSGLRQSRSADVSRMFEFHIESLFEFGRKGFHRGRNGLQIVMTDRTNSRFGIGVFVQMTTDAGIVAGVLQSVRIVPALMTGIAFDLFMLIDAVGEFSVILIRDLAGNRYVPVNGRDGHIGFGLFDATHEKDRKRRQYK